RGAFQVQHEMTDHRVRLVGLALKNSDFEEKEVSYPVEDRGGSFNAFFDYIRLVHPDKWKRAGEASLTMRHEFSHAIMSDAYPTLVRWIGFLAGGGAHTMGDVTNRDFAWLEGWPEFLGNVTYALRYGLPIDDLESQDAPWRPNLPSTQDRSPIEGEVASALWDIYDGMGWEKRFKQVPEVPGEEQFFDGIEDPVLAKIWKIVSTYHPYSFYLGDDDFVDYWLDSAKYGQHQALKAILRNRGMQSGSATLRQRPPRLSVGAVSWSGSTMRIPVDVTEEDPEDRAQVYLETYINGQRLGMQRLADGWNGSGRHVDLETEVFWVQGMAPLSVVVHAHDHMDSAFEKRDVTPPQASAVGSLGVEVTGVRVINRSPNAVSGVAVSVVADNRVGFTSAPCRVPETGGYNVARESEFYTEVSGRRALMTQVGTTPGSVLHIRFLLTGQMAGRGGIEGAAETSFLAGANYGLGAHVLRVRTPDSLEAEVAYRVRGFGAVQQALSPNAGAIALADLHPAVPVQMAPQGTPQLPGPAAGLDLALLSPGRLVSKANRLRDEYARLQTAVLEAAEVLQWRLDPARVQEIQGGTVTAPTAPMVLPGIPIQRTEERPRTGSFERPQVPNVGDTPDTTPVAGGRALPPLLEQVRPARGETVLKPITTPFLEAAMVGQGVVQSLPAKARTDIVEMQGELRALEERLNGLPGEAEATRAQIEQAIGRVNQQAQLQPAVRSAQIALLHDTNARLAAISATVPEYRVTLKNVRQVAERAVGLLRSR
ncbi:MAG: hypothetical protein QHJ73_03680, partial [Armatimonadota bacterium]|nr:hypothetical protein [Armatimonadota bacterium]